MTQPAVHADGDQAQYRDQVFRMHWLAGEPYAADDEACSTSPTVRR
ncbi:hypothetical protein [Mycobacterium sp. SMC-2]